MVGFCGCLHGAPMQMGPNPWRVRPMGVGRVLWPFAWGAHANGREPLTRSSGGVGPFRRPFAWGAHANGRRTVGAELTWGWPVPAAICMGRPCKNPLDPIGTQAPSFGPPSGGDYGGGTISHAWRPQRGRRIEEGGEGGGATAFPRAALEHNKSTIRAQPRAQLRAQPSRRGGMGMTTLASPVYFSRITRITHPIAPYF